MISRVDQLVSLLAGTHLEGRGLAEISILDSEHQAMLIELEASDLQESWSTARALVDKTGRWPVAVTCWDASSQGTWAERFVAEDLFNRSYFTEGADGLDVSPQALCDRAGSLDLAEFLSRDGAEEAEMEPLDEVLEDMLEQTAETFGEAPSVDDIENARQSGAKITTAAELDRWLAGWERSRFPDRVMNRDEIGTEDWFEPDGPCALLLLPVETGADALAYVSWYAGAGRDDAELIALLRSWQRDFGAELVAHWGTMLQLKVHQPPDNENQAWQLAREHTLAAPCTILLPGTPLRDYARALVGSDRWFLHERP